MCAPKDLVQASPPSIRPAIPRVSPAPAATLRLRARTLRRLADRRRASGAMISPESRGRMQSSVRMLLSAIALCAATSLSAFGADRVKTATVSGWAAATNAAIWRPSMLRTLAAFVGAIVLWQAPAPAPTPSALSSDARGWIDLLADASLKEWTRVPLGCGRQAAAGRQRQPLTMEPRRGARTPGLPRGQVGARDVPVCAEAGDFILHVEWRYAGPAEEKAYNSGVFARASADSGDPGTRRRPAPAAATCSARRLDGKPAREPARQDGREPREAGGRVERLRNPRGGQDA